MASDGKNLVSLDNFESLGKNCVINSPRSLEAVLRLGYDTSELAPRSPESFKVKGEPSELASLRYEHFSQRRHIKVTEAKQERDNIIHAMELQARREEEKSHAKLAASASGSNNQADEWAAMRKEQDEAEAAKKGGISRSASAPEFVGNAMSDQDAELARRTEKMLQTEKERILKVKKRQQMEIQSMLQNENRRIMAQRKAEEVKRKEEQRMRELQKKREDKLEVARQKREARRQQLEERQIEEERRMNELAISSFRQQKKLAILKEQNEKKMKIEAQKRQQERLRKAAIRREKTKSILRHLEEEGDKRLVKLKEADRRRLLKTEEAVKKRCEEAKLKKEKSLKRILAARAQADAALEMKRTNMLKKQEKEAKKQQTLAEQAAVKSAKLMEERQAKDALRLERLESMREEQTMKVISFEKKMKQRAGYIHVVHAEAAKRQAVAKLKKELAMEEKRDRVKQLTRQKEYKRERKLKKIADAEKHLKKTQEQKQALVNQRKEAAIGIARRKFELKKSMDLIRTTGRYEMMDCLTEHGTISKAKRRKQLRAQKKAKKGEGSAREK